VFGLTNLTYRGIMLKLKGMDGKFEGAGHSKRCSMLRLTGAVSKRIRKCSRVLYLDLALDLMKMHTMHFAVVLRSFTHLTVYLYASA